MKTKVRYSIYSLWYDPTSSQNEELVKSDELEQCIQQNVVFWLAFHFGWIFCVVELEEVSQIFEVPYSRILAFGDDYRLR